MTIHDAISLLFKATEKSKGGEIFVMAMPACRIIDLAEVLVESMGKTGVAFKEIGIRPGEKIHEILFSENEQDYTIVYDDEYFVILPSTQSPELKAAYSHYPKVKMKNYISSDALMSKEEIKQLLKQGGFLQ